MNKESPHALNGNPLAYEYAIIVALKSSKYEFQHDFTRLTMAKVPWLRM